MEPKEKITLPQWFYEKSTELRIEFDRKIDYLMAKFYNLNND